MNLLTLEAFLRIHGCSAPYLGALHLWFFSSGPVTNSVDGETCDWSDSGFGCDIGLSFALFQDIDKLAYGGSSSVAETGLCRWWEGGEGY